MSDMIWHEIVIEQYVYGTKNKERHKYTCPRCQLVAGGFMTQDKAAMAARAHLDDKHSREHDE